MKGHKKLWMIGMLGAVLVSSREAAAWLVIDESLADPPAGLAGDANRDGIRSASDDEFVELLNTGKEEVDLSLWSLWDAQALRHQFQPGARLPSLQRLVIFGGGNPTGIPSFTLTASSGALSLNNLGDEILLKNFSREVIDHVSYSDEANLDQSLNRFPDGTGPFRLHRLASSPGLPFSPGTDPDGRNSSSTPVAPEPCTGLLFGLGFLVANKLRLFQRGGYQV